MSLPSSTFTSYLAIGNREDLSNMIYRIDPTDTPFISSIEKTEATAVNHEWQTQALASVDTANAVLEGDDATTDAVTADRPPRQHRADLATRCRASPAPSRLSSTPAATTSWPTRRCSKGLELKRDIESILAGTNQAKNAGDAATARMTASVLSLDQVEHAKGAGGADPSAADGTGTRTDGTQRAFTEAQPQDRAALDLDERRQARRDHDRRLQQAGVLDVYGPRNADRGGPNRRRSSPPSTPMSAISAPSRWCQPLLADARRAGAAVGHVGARLSQRPQHDLDPLAKTGDSDRVQCSASTRSRPATRRPPAACST